MRMRKMILGIAAGVLAAFVVAPATPAAASGPTWPPPPDCTVSSPNNYTSSLTCTNRPAGQQWRSYRLCEGPWLDSDAWGNVVTGNGTSTAACYYTWARPTSYVYFWALN